MVEKVRVAFVGAGNLATLRHYPSLSSLPDVELAAIAELNPERARKAAAQYGIERTYSDYKKMLEEIDPQAVYVIMPPQHLFDVVVTVLKQKRAVFIEKPPGLTTLQTREFAYYAEQNGCVTQVGFQRRFVPAMTELKRRVEQRGPLHFAAVSFLKPTADLTQQAGRMGGVIDVLTFDGIHAVDTLAGLLARRAALHRRHQRGPRRPRWSHLRRGRQNDGADRPHLSRSVRRTSPHTPGGRAGRKRRRLIAWRGRSGCD